MDNIEKINKAIKNDPNNALCYIERGISYLKWNQADKALDDCTKAIELEPNNAEFYMQRADCYSRLNQQEKRLADFNKAAQLDPDNAMVYSNQGDAYNQTNQYDKALTDFMKSIELDSNNAWAHLQCAYIYDNLNQHDKAVEKFTEVINSDHQKIVYRPYLYFCRTRSYKALTRYDKAEEDFAKAIELASDVYKQRFRELWAEEDNEMFDIIKKAIDKKDVLGLLEMGTPDDEYDIESRDIASKINTNSSVDEIADVCSSVFTSWFCADSRFSTENFTEVAQEIKNEVMNTI